MLKQAIKDYIQENWIKKLCMLSWLSDQTINNVLKWIRPQKRTVDILYKVLNLQVDERYISNLNSRYSDSDWIWRIIKTIRIFMWYDQEQFAKKLDVSTRTLQRIEKENYTPKKDVCERISELIAKFFLEK